MEQAEPLREIPILWRDADGTWRVRRLLDYGEGTGEPRFVLCGAGVSEAALAREASALRRAGVEAEAG
jgi:hypothetical protein